MVFVDGGPPGWPAPDLKAGMASSLPHSGGKTGHRRVGLRRGKGRTVVLRVKSDRTRHQRQRMDPRRRPGGLRRFVGDRRCANRPDWSECGHPVALGAVRATLRLPARFRVVQVDASLVLGEIGIRVALGADRSRVIRIVVCNGMTLILIGLVAGFGVSLAAVRLLRTMLYGKTCMTGGRLALERWCSSSWRSSPATCRRDGPRDSIRWSRCARNDTPPTPSGAALLVHLRGINSQVAQIPHSAHLASNRRRHAQAPAPIASISNCCARRRSRPPIAEPG